MKKFLLILFLLIIPLLAEQAPILKKTTPARRIHSQAPKIDGILDDEVWQDAPFIDQFTQFNPIEGAKPSECTAFKVLYDDYNIYFGIQMNDSQPSEIAARLSRRDDVDNSDFVAIGLDSYHDRRTAFIFGLNAAGVKFDQVLSNDGENDDDSWDPVWEGRAALMDSGWVAEMRIPFSQLRFAEQKEQTWGFQVYRKIFRKQEEVMWQLIPKDAAGLVSYFGKLKGIKNIIMPRRVEIMPYTVSSLNRYEKEKGNPFADGNDFSFNGGVDGKIGLSSNSDPSEVNLSAFETFFEEKRPFFIEGKNIFRFPLAMGDGDMSSETLFYSRRIGRSPHYYPDEDDGFYYDYVDQPDNSRILGAMKLSGKTKKGWSIGILDALTRKETATIENNGQRKQVAVEPLTNFFVNRLQKDFNNGNTSFGGIVTATNRRIEDKQLNFLNKSAYTGGIDIRHQWDNKTYFMDLKIAGSHLMGEPEAIEQVQTASARYFQRPDARHVSLDTSRTSISGHGGSLNIGRVGNGRWRYAVGGLWRSPGFETNDLGYLRQADQIMSFVWIGYRINNPVGIFRRVNINTNGWQGWNFGGDRLFVGGNINGGAQFLNYWGFHGGINRQQSGLSPWFLRGGPMARYMGSWNSWFNIYSDERKDWRIRLNPSMNKSDDGISRSYRFRFSLFYRINDRLNINLDPFYRDRIENLQYVDTPEFNNEDRYIFGEMHQETFGVVFRLNYSLTPDLSIQYYGQPFVSAGKYSKYKRITNPRAAGKERYTVFKENQIAYNEEDELFWVDENIDGASDYGFEKPDFNYKQFLSNLVVRWEYLPGSTVYLVWSQTRTGYEEVGRFSLNNDMQNLFTSVPDNVWLVKMNYWFSL